MIVLSQQAGRLPVAAMALIRYDAPENINTAGSYFDRFPMNQTFFCGSGILP